MTMPTENIENPNALNDAQQQAVSIPPQNMLVLAGAGSGKTRVLAHRIAYLIEQQQASPFNILAVTFTNKAANEMRGRIERLLGFSAQGMWVGTFHGLAHRLLRLHFAKVNLAENFQIIDSDDQYRMIKRLMTLMGLDEKQWPPKKAQWFINAKKDDGLRAAHLPQPPDAHTRTLIKIYQQYEELCERGSLVDFAELLLRVQELFQQDTDILEHYQSRFQYVLVDEFQDTNKIQYDFIYMLAQKSILMAVGDDDQSIYGWRGAKIENMKKLARDFSPLHTIRLEQNYRSTGNILNAANHLIKNNTNRLGKNLWTQDDLGEKISLYEAFNETDESRYITESIRAYYQKNHYYQHCAILYRSNAQSRVLEEALIQAGIPYRIYGGLRFFDRAEIKDALGYLKLIVNPHDDGAFERVINMPARGIGEQTLNTLRVYAREQKISLWSSADFFIKEKKLTPRACSAVLFFMNLISDLQQDSQHLNLSELTERVLQVSGLLAHYHQEKGEKGQTRVENLQELISAAGQFYDENQNQHQDQDQDSQQILLSPLCAFLANAALESGESQSDAAAADYVQLMTLHSAKGLEFPVVFLAGMEEGLFPHQLSISEQHQLEEERRLCYVGVTRAMKKLYLTYAQSRRLHGQQRYHRVSRFVSEMPENVLEEVRLRTQISRPSYPGYTASKKFNLPPENASHHNPLLTLGRQVRHPVFGEGTVINFEGSGEYARIQIQFKQVGAKWLVASYAKLEIMS